MGVQCSHSSELPRTNSCCSVPPFLGNDGAREKLHKVPPGFDRAARETGARAEIPWRDYQGSERNLEGGQGNLSNLQ